MQPEQIKTELKVVAAEQLAESVEADLSAEDPKEGKKFIENTERND